MREQYFPQWNLPSYYPYISLDLEKESIEYCPQISHILSSLCYGQPILKDQTRHQNITYLRWHIWQRSVCFVTPRRQPSSRGIATWWLRSSAVTTSRHAAFAERQWRFLRSKQRREDKNNFLICNMWPFSKMTSVKLSGFLTPSPCQYYGFWFNVLSGHILSC